MVGHRGCSFVAVGLCYRRLGRRVGIGHGVFVVVVPAAIIVVAVVVLFVVLFVVVVM